jgi:group I intron endonuclease
MKNIGIYKITSPSNKIYIGQSIDIDKRFKTYLRYSCKSQPKLLASLNKYGSENHIYEIIELCNANELSIKEKYYVDLYDSFNNGLNIRDGGGNSAKLSQEQKEKISKSLTGVKHSKERIEANRKGQLGKKLSEEHKKKIKLGSTKPNLGKKASLETRLKQSLSHIGKPSNRLGCKLTEEQKKYLSNINKGENNPNFGVAKSQESKNKVSESLKLYWANKKLSLCQK